MLVRSLLVFAVAVPAASAHFPYIVPEGPNKARVVFSDTLKADDKVPVDRLANLKLRMTANAKTDDLTITLDKKTNVYRVDVPGDGARVVAGTLDYGVLQRGDAKPFRLKYHPKAVFGAWADAAAGGPVTPLEVTPVADGGKLRFVVKFNGKAVAKAEVSVMVPGEEKPKAVVTDAAGATEVFDKAGQYGVQAKHAEAAAGEVDGKKYAEVRHYATLVVTVGK